MKKTYYKIMTFIFQLFNKRKLDYYPRYYYYEILLDKYRDGLFYSNLINNLKKTDGIKTDTEIRLFDNKIPNEVVINDIIRKYGKPNYKIIYEDLFEIKVLFYRQKLGEHKTKVEFHFFRNNLFFYTYTFPYLNLENKNEIIQMIKEKYLEGKSEDIINNFITSNLSYIVDKNKNIILYNDSIDFSIYYYCDNKKIMEKIMESIDFMKVKNEIKQKRNKLMLYKRL